MQEQLRAAATGSGAKRWMHCPGSVAMCMGLTDDKNDDTTEGDRLHDICEDAVKFNTPMEHVVDHVDDKNNYFVQTAVQEVRKDCPGPFVTEERLYGFGSSGQLDVYWISPDETEGKIWDYKFGIGVKLVALLNEQMAFYACLLKMKYPKLKVIHITMIQPKVNKKADGEEEINYLEEPSITYWTIKYQTILAWTRKFEKALLKVEEARELKAGEWCHTGFCKARPICPVFLAFNTMASKPENLVPAVQELAQTPANISRIAFIVSQQKRVTGWFPKAKAWLKEILENGGEVPGFELVPKRTNRIYIPILEPEEIAEELIKRGVTDPYKPRELLSLTQVEKMVVDGKKIDIKDLVEKPYGGKTLKFVGGDDDE